MTQGQLLNLKGTIRKVISHMFVKIILSRFGSVIFIIIVSIAVEYLVVVYFVFCPCKPTRNYLYTMISVRMAKKY